MEGSTRHIDTRTGSAIDSTTGGRVCNSLRRMEPLVPGSETACITETSDGSTACNCSGVCREKGCALIRVRFTAKPLGTAVVVPFNVLDAAPDAAGPASTTNTLPSANALAATRIWDLRFNGA